MDLIPLKETKPIIGKVPPHNKEAEESVLGAILLENEAITQTAEFLTSEDFYLEAHQMIFGAMMQLNEKGKNVDLISLTDFLRKNPRFETLGGASYLASLTQVVPSAANVVQHAQLVKKHSVLRQVIHNATEIVQKGFSEPADVETFLDESEKSVFSISLHHRRKSFFRLKEVIKDSIRTITERAANKGELTGVTSGFSDLDKLTCGFQNSDLIIVAGRPSMGKTAFCLNATVNAALLAKVPVAIFSLEMSKEQLVMRMLSSEAKIDSNKIRTGALDEDDSQRLYGAAESLYEAPIFVDDTPSITTMALRSKARRLKIEKDIGMVVIDYLQLMRSSGSAPESREREISDISRSLKALAKELNIPVIAVSQLNRSVESRVEKRPLNSDLRESGALEQDADIIGFIYRDEVYRPETDKLGIAEFILSKQRNGPTGVVQLTFLNRYTRFENLAYQSQTAGN